MSYVNKVYENRPYKDVAFEDEDWADLVSPSQRKSSGKFQDEKDHRELTHRDAEKQHPIEAIDGLVEALKGKISDGDVHAEKTSEGTLLTIGSTSVMIYDGVNGISSISVNGKVLPIVGGNVNITTDDIADGMDISNSIVKIQKEEADTTIPVSKLVELIMSEIGTIKDSVSETSSKLDALGTKLDNKIIFKIWPGLQGDN